MFHFFERWNHHACFCFQGANDVIPPSVIRSLCWPLWYWWLCLLGNSKRHKTRQVLGGSPLSLGLALPSQAVSEAALLVLLRNNKMVGARNLQTPRKNFLRNSGPVYCPKMLESSVCLKIQEMLAHFSNSFNSLYSPFSCNCGILVRFLKSCIDRFREM